MIYGLIIKMFSINITVDHALNKVTRGLYIFHITILLDGYENGINIMRRVNFQACMCMSPPEQRRKLINENLTIIKMVIWQQLLFYQKKVLCDATQLQKTLTY